MLFGIRKLVGCSLFLVSLKPCAGDIPPDVVDRGKKSTALVVLDQDRGYASAFCIDPTGIFVTNNHVLQSATKVQLVLWPGEREQEIVDANVIREDKNTDLALVKVNLRKPLPSLVLGDSNSLTETTEVAAFGYPFGKDLAVGMGQFPAVTVSLGHVTALRKEGGVLKQIQLDASLNPGNSGGPVVDSKGRVIGIVESGIRGSGINFAIPAKSLKSFFETPSVVLSPIDLSVEKQREPREFTVQILSNEAFARVDSVDLIITAGLGDKRIYPMKSEDGHVFRTMAIPLPTESGSVLLVRARTGAKEIICRVRDQVVVVGSERVRLRLIRRIEGRSITMSGGQTMTGIVRGLNAVDTLVDGASVQLNLTASDVVTLEELERSQTPAEYRVTARRDGKVVGEASGVFGRVPMSAKSVAGGGVSVPTGKWTVTYKNGVRGTYEFLRDGLVQWVEETRNVVGRMYSVGGKFIIDYPDDRLERITYDGQRLIVEHWYPKDRFRDSPPAAVGYGIRSN